MPSLRITKFGGINTEVAARLLDSATAQIAHNCLLWEGSLRPLAKWNALSGISYTGKYSIDLSEDNTIVKTSELIGAVFLKGRNYPIDTTVGLTIQPEGLVESNVVYSNRNTDPAGAPVGVHKPRLGPLSGVSYSREFKSNKAVSRMYGVTAIRDNGNGVEESTISVIPNQSAQSIVYEGDIALLTIIVEPPATGYTGIRVYRAITGMDTGTSATNEFDTDWHLVAELPGSTTSGYADGGSVTDDLLDTYLAEGFYPPPPIGFSFIELLEGGWVAAATKSGDIAISERFMYHAWPIENRFLVVGENITDCKAQFDNLFIGTKNRPYILAASTGEKLALQAQITPFPETYECLPGSMDKTPSGAMYASPSGLVSLSREGMRLVTAGVASGVRPLYHIPRKIEVTIEGETVERNLTYPMRFQHTVYGAYNKGMYIGFCRVDTREENEALESLYLFKGYMAFVGSSLDGDRPLQRMTTLDTPDAVRAHVVGGSGVYVLAADGVYKMPFPDSVGDEEYTRAAKMCYTWKSKKHVFPGNMTMAAAKVVHDCKGFVRIKIYADCCCVYETAVRDCKPFMLPPNIYGTEYEVELVGTSTVHEVHIASSLRELLENG